MSTPKHTPDPWSISAFSPTLVFKTQKFGRRESHTQLANANPEDFHCFTERGKEAEANAARIVACVNACEGINPEAVPELLSWLKDVEQNLLSREKYTQYAILMRRLIAKAEGKT